MLSLVLAKKTAEEVVFFKYPDLITRELRLATKFATTNFHLKGFFHMPVEKAEQEVHRMMMRDG
jgi:hypothetical protein